MVMLKMVTVALSLLGRNQELSVVTHEARVVGLVN